MNYDVYSVYTALENCVFLEFIQRSNLNLR